MSHYSECYYDLHKKEFEEDVSCERIKKRLVSELKAKQMIQIMFSNYIEDLNNEEVRELETKYLYAEDLL